MAAESVHGAIRRWLIAPEIGDLPARQVGVVVGSAIVFAMTWLTARWIGAESLSERLRVGSAWLLLTVFFECGLGIAMGVPIARILADYDPRQGGYMVLGLAFMLASPTLVGMLRERA